MNYFTTNHVSLLINKGFVSGHLFKMNDNNESLAANATPAIASSATTTKDTDKLEVILAQIGSMASTIEKALAEIPNSCANAMHDCVHLITNAINKGNTSGNRQLIDKGVSNTGKQ